MEFTTAIPIDRCRRLLAEHASRIPVFADTDVLINPIQGQHSEFAVRRMWKGLKGLVRYNVMEINGTLSAASGTQTQISSQIQLKAMGFVTIIIAIVLFLMGLSSPRTFGLGILIGLFLLGLLIYDWFVLRGIMKEIQY
jgi:hypothetical protein